MILTSKGRVEHGRETQQWVVGSELETHIKVANVR